MSSFLKQISTLTLFAAFLLTAVFLMGLTRSADALFLDSLYHLRGPQATQGDVVLVGLDEAFIQAYDTPVSLLDRRFYARVLDTLHDAGAKAVGLDVFFPEPTPQDDMLAQSVRRSEAVLPHIPLRTVGLYDTGRDAPFRRDEHLRYNPLLQDARRGVLSIDEMARVTRPVFRFADSEMPSFALAVVQAAGLEPQHIDRPYAERLIDYRGPAGSFPRYSFLDVYRRDVSFEAFRNKIVLVGVTLVGTERDQILTPFGVMPGTEVLANEVYTLLHGQLGTVPLPLTALLILLASLGWPPVIRERKYALLLTLFMMVVVLLASSGLFLLGWYFPPLMLLLTLIVTYVLVSYERLRTLDRELSLRLSRLFDTVNLGPGLAQTEPALAPTEALQGFSPLDEQQDGPDMLRSLQSALGGSAGLLVLDGQSYATGESEPMLEQLALQASASGRTVGQGNLPHHLATPLVIGNDSRGALALTLPAPPPPHLKHLIEQSVRVFGQSAQYRDLHRRTTTMVQTLWPWNARSSEAKIEAINVITDLLQTERSWLGVLLENLPQAVFISGPYGFSIYKNPAAQRLLGNERNLLQAVPAALRLEPERFRQDFVRTVEYETALELATTETATGRPIMLTLHTVTSGGQVRAVAGVVHDVSRMEELHRARQEMVAAVAHDLRTPLTSIIGFADLLLLELQDEEARENAGLILSEAERMKRLTDDFLELNRLELTSLTLQRSACNAAELLRYAVAATSPLAAKKGMSIAIVAPAFVEASLDTDLMNRALVNLLSNAVQYSPPGTRVSTRLEGREGYLFIEIADEGYGISKEDLTRIFEKFARVKEGPQAKTKGSGLGLFLVKRIVEEHGGRVEVTSERGKGSAFRLFIPLP